MPRGPLLSLGGSLTVMARALRRAWCFGTFMSRKCHTGFTPCSNTLLCLTETEEARVIREEARILQPVRCWRCRMTYSQGFPGQNTMWSTEAPLLLANTCRCYLEHKQDGATISIKNLLL